VIAKKAAESRWRKPEPKLEPEPGQSHLQLPLQNSGGQTIGSVRLTLLAAVDATSGNSTIGVNFSNLTFTQQATANDKQHMLAALSTTLPGAT
jgi:hypothetical protein